jgi:hypothetical protein
MYAEAQAFLDRTAAFLNAADHRGLVAAFDFPLALHVEGSLVVYVNAAAMIEGLQRFRQLLAQDGLVTMLPRLRAVEIPRQGRFRIWAHWEHFDAQGRQRSRSDYLYHCHQGRGRITVEMVQVTRAATRRLVPAQPVQAFRA